MPDPEPGCGTESVIREHERDNWVPQSETAICTGFISDHTDWR